MLLSVCMAPREPGFSEAVAHPTPLTRPPALLGLGLDPAVGERLAAVLVVWSGCCGRPRISSRSQCCTRSRRGPGCLLLCGGRCCACQSSPVSSAPTGRPSARSPLRDGGIWADVDGAPAVPRPLHSVGVGRCRWRPPPCWARLSRSMRGSSVCLRTEMRRRRPRDTESSAGGAARAHQRVYLSCPDSRGRSDRAHCRSADVPRARAHTRRVLNACRAALMALSEGALWPRMMLVR